MTVLNATARLSILLGSPEKLCPADMLRGPLADKWEIRRNCPDVCGTVGSSECWLLWIGDQVDPAEHACGTCLAPTPMPFCSDQCAEADSVHL